MTSFASSKTAFVHLFFDDNIRKGFEDYQKSLETFIKFLRKESNIALKWLHL